MLFRVYLRFIAEHRRTFGTLSLSQGQMAITKRVVHPKKRKKSKVSKASRRFAMSRTRRSSPYRRYRLYGKGQVAGDYDSKPFAHTAIPTSATHAILAQLKAGETVHQAGELPKTPRFAKIHYEVSTNHLKHLASV